MDFDMDFAEREDGGREGRRDETHAKRERSRMAREDLRAVAMTAEGARCLGRLLTESGLFAALNVVSHQEAAFAEGRRRAGLLLLANLKNAAPERVTDVVLFSLNDGRGLR